MTRSAVVLAAGRGARLGELTIALPKSLLEVAPGVTILSLLLTNLVEAGIQDVTIMTGYLSERFESVRVPDGLNLRTIFVPEWETTNNIVTFGYALRAATEDFLLINSDVVVPRDGLRAVLKREGSALAVDATREPDPEAMKVAVKDRFVSKLSKQLSAEAVFGEYVGLARIAALDNCALLGATDDLLRCGGHSLYYEDAITKAIEDGTCRFSSVPFSDRWAEVDTNTDLVNARRLVSGGRQGS